MEAVMKRVAIASAFAVLFIGQAAPSMWMAVDHSQRLKEGREVTLAVETRDPRDLFRGEYSVLSYEIARPRNVQTSTSGLASGCDLTSARSCSVGPEQPVFIRLQPDQTGVHRAAQVMFEQPTDGAPFIVGKVRAGAIIKGGVGTGAIRCEREACFEGIIAFGIETWYGPQGVPAQVDRIDRKDIVVRAKVDASGRPALDALVVKGQDFARTPRLL
jgi:uncharacterized membrane-anchored protein